MRPDINQVLWSAFLATNEYFLPSTQKESVHGNNGPLTILQYPRSGTLHFYKLRNYSEIFGVQRKENFQCSRSLNYSGKSNFFQTFLELQTSLRAQQILYNSFRR